MSVTTRTRPFRRWLRVEPLEDRTTPTGLTVNPGTFASDHVLVSLTHGPNTAATAAALGTSPLAAGVKQLGFDIYRVNLQPGVAVNQAIAAFNGVGGVAFAEPDYAIGVDVTKPNDPKFADGTLWGMNNTGQNSGTIDADIDAPEAWDIATGTGTHVVAVIDTGIDYNHPDLAANIWTNPGEVAGDGIDNDGNGFIDDIHGYDFVNGDGDPMDDNDHGTHCAGTIGGVGNNGVGVTGVAWTTRIMAVKFLAANGSGFTSDAVLAINYAVANGAKILSNSWGGGGYSLALEQAIIDARNAGAIFVAAAGNAAANNDTTPNYPSNYAEDNVLAVAATDRNDQLASFSSYGATTVDLGAPGVAITSTTPNNTYSSFSGTSMATPHVAGALAVFWDANPSLTYSQVIQKLLGSVDPIASLAGKTVTGGRLNLKNLLDSGGGSPRQPPAPDTTGPRVIAGAFVGSQPYTFDRVRITFNEPIAVATFTTADVVALRGQGGVAVAPTGVVPVPGTINQFDVMFPTTAAYGTGYLVSIGPNITDVAGNNMDQNQNGVKGEVPADRYSTVGTLYPPRQTFALSGLNVTIPDLGTATVTINVPASSAVNGFKVTDLNVKLSLTHTYDSDMIITLTNPTGQVVTLFNHRGGGGDNLTNTIFNDEATLKIADGSAPFTGYFRPDSLLSVFDARYAVGNWVLKIQDTVGGDSGVLTDVSLDIGTDPIDKTRVKTFGERDGVGSDTATAPVSVGGKPAINFTPLTPAAPQLLAPPVPAAVKFVPSWIQPPTDVGVTVDRPIAPPPAAATRFEPATTDWTWLTHRRLTSGFTVE